MMERNALRLSTLIVSETVSAATIWSMGVKFLADGVPPMLIAASLFALVNDFGPSAALVLTESLREEPLSEDALGVETSLS